MPTSNPRPDPYIVFYTRDRLSPLPAVANYGRRPTVEPDALTPKLEIHSLIDLNSEEWRYGSDIEMSLKHFIRPEKKFDSLDELKSQIDRDKQMSKALVYPT